MNPMDIFDDSNARRMQRDFYAHEQMAGRATLPLYLKARL